MGKSLVAYDAENSADCNILIASTYCSSLFLLQNWNSLYISVDGIFFGEARSKRSRVMPLFDMLVYSYILISCDKAGIPGYTHHNQ